MSTEADESITQEEEEMTGSHFIRLRGLPWSVTHQEILDFLQGVNVVNDAKGIHLVTNRWDGKNTGEAFVELQTEEDEEQAFSHNKEMIGHRYIEIFHASNEEAEHAIRKPGQPSNVVKLRGLPYAVTDEMIDNFFEGLEIKPDREGILIVMDKRGRATGEAYVQFETQDDTEQALKLNREKIGHRYIEIFRSSLAEMKRQNSNTRSGPYDKRDRGGSRGGMGMGGGGMGGGGMGGGNDFGGRGGRNQRPRGGSGGFSSGGGGGGNFNGGGNFGGGGGGGNFGGSGGNFGSGGGGGGFGGGNMGGGGGGFNNGFGNSGGGGGGGGGGFGDFNNFGNNRNFNGNSNFNDGPFSNRGGSGGGGGGGGNSGGGFGNDNFFGGMNDNMNMNRNNNSNFGFGPIGGGRNEEKLFGIHLRGLPYYCFESDVNKFFEPLRPVKVKIIYNKSGLHSGSADAYFGTHEEAVQAMKKHREKMGSRYIELFYDGKGKKDNFRRL